MVFVVTLIVGGFEIIISMVLKTLLVSYIGAVYVRDTVIEMVPFNKEHKRTVF